MVEKAASQISCNFHTTVKFLMTALCCKRMNDMKSAAITVYYMFAVILLCNHIMHATNELD